MDETLGVLVQGQEEMKRDVQNFMTALDALEILEKAVVDAGVTATLNFAEATTSEPTLPASEVYKTPCYHWMTHVKQTKDVSNEYDPIFVLKHEVLYEGLREYFMFLMPKEQVHATVVCIYSIILNEIKVQQYQELIYIMPLDIVNFMLQTHDESYIDKSTNKAYRFNIEQYAHHCQFFDKRKLASHPFLFVPICNGAHWWLWIADVNKKKFYVLDPINKLPKNIHDSRKTVNKFVVKKEEEEERKNRERMGRVRTKTVKKSSRQVIERYYSRMTLDFHTNKKVLEEVALIPSKRLRNKIAGFSTHLMKRIQKGPVRGISLKLQEEERERRMDFVPDVSAIDTQHIEVDKETIDMLQSLGMSDIPGITQVDPVPVQQIPFGRPGAGFGGAQRRY
ncbi:hypothetical protein Ahy_A07g036144 [Arachis hypogaea]|uniref:Uncharacterized protein n=2 Tax=Arachis TaxID=3817 RepID=A0A445CFD3_ARAHY|nr:hypothetical protein Ahy_A07g036144 [Arachis hypogaea]